MPRVVRQAWRRYIGTLKEVDNNMLQVKQLLCITAAVVGTDAQVEQLPDEEPDVGTAMRLNRGIGLAPWNLERKFERHFMVRPAKQKINLTSTFADGWQSTRAPKLELDSGKSLKTSCRSGRSLTTCVVELGGEQEAQLHDSV